MRCVIETPLADGMAGLVHLPKGLKVTPWHPVRINGKWEFPSSLQPVIESPCPSLFSFLLNDGHSMQINGVECVTVAHHFVESPVVKHNYFGTNEIIKDLIFMKGWMNGHVQLLHNPVIRDPKTNNIVGL